ncbi:hypothetical protein HNR42_000570 [Deinobacterium chartae]|uniref:Uncharacterized protein n=1 Tax=Deinobacterium chartae TaxID=521158 RepID=A0A841HW64_9DEIO|nr:hypothetical protein [Deinobacterium chartae]MBB6097156.1 hypothetical protein [Deinobacterium chartae]
MPFRWIALYQGADTHPRLFDSLERALEYLARQERLEEHLLDALATRVLSLGSGDLAPPVTRVNYRLTYVRPGDAEAL